MAFVELCTHSPMIYRVLAFLAILSPALSSVSCRQDCQHSAIPTSTRTPRKSTGDLRAVRGEIIRPSVPQLQQHRHTSHNGESPHQHSNGPNLGVTCWVIPGTSVALPGAWGRRQYMRHVRQGHFHVPPGRKLGRRHSSLSMKVKSRSKKGGRVATGGGSTVAMGSRQRQKNASNKALYIDVENLDSDAWRLVEAGDILRGGGVGVIPTDTCYTFACDLLSRKGIERILQIKNEKGRHKPLTLLCKDISTMNTYAKGIDKSLFKTMKAVLPGPYTFILPSTNEVPRMLLDHKHHKKTWKRREIGIRLPDAPVLLELLQQLDGPLLCSSVPSELPSNDDDIFDGEESDEEDDEDEGGDGTGAREAWSDDACVSGDPAAIDRAWGHALDFVVNAGVLEVGGFSTVVDATGAQPIVLREGLGDTSLFS